MKIEVDNLEFDVCTVHREEGKFDYRPFKVREYKPLMNKARELGRELNIAHITLTEHILIKHVKQDGEELRIYADLKFGIESDDGSSAIGISEPAILDKINVDSTREFFIKHLNNIMTEISKSLGLIKGSGKKPLVH